LGLKYRAQELAAKADILALKASGFYDSYPAKGLREQRFFWNEQYQLEAFLLMNPSSKSISRLMPRSKG
jgi:hypothetical protein